MHKVHLASIPELEEKSPEGRYHLFRRSISQSLGGKKDIGTWRGGHPFDLEWVRLPAGATNFPFHAHTAQWELYFIITGGGQVRGAHDTFSVEPGDGFIFPPGEAHQITNTGTVDLIYHVIADHHPAEIATYPDTGKWGIKPQRKYFRMTETPYYEQGD